MDIFNLIAEALAEHQLIALHIHLLEDAEANAQILDVVALRIHIVLLIRTLIVLLLLLLLDATYAGVVPYLEVPATVLLSRISIPWWNNEIVNNYDRLGIFLIH